MKHRGLGEETSQLTPGGGGGAETSLSTTPPCPGARGVLPATVPDAAGGAAGPHSGCGAPTGGGLPTARGGGAGDVPLPTPDQERARPGES